MRRAPTMVSAATVICNGARGAALGREVHAGSPVATPRPLCAVDLNRLTFVDEVATAPREWSNPIGHPVWDVRDAERVVINHKPVGGVVDGLAYGLVKACRWSFDTFSGYRFGGITERKVITRCLFLETVAGVPGMVGGMVRHMSSLRGLKRDHGWIHTLLEEAENERMHLLTFMTIRQPGVLFRAAILMTQAVMFNLLFVLYLANPRFVHRFVGYLEEEAVRTYTHVMELIDEGGLPEFRTAPVPDVARAYWHLSTDATYRDMFSVIRADEAGHRLVNHTFADMHARRQANDTNPFIGRLHGGGDSPA